MNFFILQYVTKDSLVLFSPIEDILTDLLDSLGPDLLIQTSINPYIWGSHHFFGKFTDFFDSTRCSVFETTENRMQDIIKHTSTANSIDFLASS